MHVRSSRFAVAVLPSILVVAIFLTPPARAQVDPNFQQGFKQFGSYQGGDIDRVSLQNGHLTVRAPFYSLPQRGGKLNLSFSILYDNLIGTFLKATCQPPPSHICSYAVRYYGSSAGIVSDQGYGLIKNLINSGQLDGGGNPIMIPVFYLLGPDGAKHQLVYTTDGHYETIDTTGLRVDQTNSDYANPSGTLTDANGIRQPISSVFQSAPPIPFGSASYSLLEDQNGNQITYSGSTYTDTLGRNLNLTPGTANVASCPQLNFPFQSVASAVTWNFLAPNGGNMPVILCSANVYIRSSMCGSLPRCVEYSGYTSMLQSIVLPNGTYWAFQYSAANPNVTTSIAYGDLLEVILPTGGSISYTYGNTYGCNASPSSTPVRGTPQILTRTVNANDGTGSHTWNYNWGNTLTSPLVNSVTDPLGQKVVHSFASIGCSYYETQTQAYDASSNLLETMTKDYTHMNDAVSDLAGTDLVSSVVNIRATTTWPSGQVTKTETDYDAGFNYHDPTYYWVLSNSCPTCVPSYTTYPALFGKPIAVREYDYGTNAPGPLLRQTKTSYLWQSNSNYLKYNILHLISGVSVYDGSSVLKASTTFNYDESSPTASGVTTQHDSAPINTPYRGNQTSVSRWESGSVASTTNCPVTVNNGNLVSHLTFYDTGMTAQSTDPCGHATTLTYSSSFAGAFATSVQNALSQNASTNYDFNTGLITSQTDPNNLTTNFRYDVFRRPTQIKPPDGGETDYSYNDTAPTQSFTVTTKINSSQNRIVTGIVDGLGRETQTQLSDPQGTVYTVVTYDGIGRKSTVTNPYRSTSDPTYGVTTYTFDALNRKTKEAYPDGAILQKAYCGPSTLATDPDGKWRRSRTDGLGRLVEVDEPNAIGASVAATGCPGTGEPIWVTGYTFDTLGSMTQVLQNSSRQRNFTFDSLSHLLTAANPESGTVTYTYDADGNVLTKNDARNITATYSLDALHRTLGATYSNGDPAVSYVYDQTNCLGLAQCANIGHRTSMTDAGGSEIWAFDVVDRIHKEQRTNTSSPSNISKSTTYNLDLAGNLTSVVYPTGRTINYTYDSASRPSVAQDSSNGITYALGTCANGIASNGVCYAPPGTVSSVTIGQNSGFAGLNFTGSYNNRLQPNEFKASSTAGNAIDITYSFVDPSTSKNAGHVFSITNNLNSNRTQSFAYDQLNRITTAGTTATTGTYCWGYQYSYDPWGNLLAQAGWSPNYNGCSETTMGAVTTNGSNQISGFTYDASGNTQSDGTISYAYNAESQMKTANGVTYAYDGDGRRVSKSNGKLYWYGSGGEILAETDASGNTLNEYIFFGGKRIAMLPAASNPIYYVEDMLGTSRLITQNNGAVCYDADFDPYGGEHAYTNICPQNYKFEGKERDTETSNDDFGARYYSNRFGRWLSADWSAVPVPVPYANLINPQTLNLYSMVSDDPESFADLDGHASTSEYQLGNSGGGWDPTFAGSMVDDSGLTQVEFDLLKSAEIAEYQQQQQAKQQPGQVSQAGAAVAVTAASGSTTAAGTAAGTAVADALGPGTVAIAAAWLCITNVANTLIENARGREQLAAVESIVAVENARLLLASRIKETVGYLTVERTNFLNHVGLTSANNNPDPDGRNRWTKQLQQKLQNMKDVLKRLPEKSRVEWGKAIESLQEMLPK
jgi:RHS repeat-associated protein